MNENFEMPGQSRKAGRTVGIPLLRTVWIPLLPSPSVDSYVPVRGPPPSSSVDPPPSSAARTAPESGAHGRIADGGGPKSTLGTHKRRLAA
jgi:hypothetical protein